MLLLLTNGRANRTGLDLKPLAVNDFESGKAPIMSIPKCQQAEFIRAIVKHWWSHDCLDIDGCDFQEIAEEHGVVIRRKPTKEEFADPDWFGHEFDIGPDDPGVYELHPDLKPKE